MIPRADFIARYRALFEHSPWVVERAADRRPLAGLMRIDADATPAREFATPLHEIGEVAGCEAYAEKFDRDWSPAPAQAAAE